MEFLKIFKITLQTESEHAVAADRKFAVYSFQLQKAIQLS